MKKSGSLIKVTACLVACLVLVISNPIKVEAGWWDCLWGNHRIVTYYVPPTCQTYGYSESVCGDCGKFYWREYAYEIGLGAHCYSTDPYKAPICQICGRRKK